jgi:simple sugar transport system ATP-binding protein
VAGDAAPGKPGRPVLEFRGVAKSYGHVEALRGVDLDLLGGEVHALVGDNGAGKSTLLKVAAGVVSPDAGEILIHGQPIHVESPLHARDMGIETVYQDLALADERSAAANVYLGREVLRKGPLGRLGFLDRPTMESRTSEEFAQLKIPIAHVRQRVRFLSGGQRQGVAIARAAMWARHVVLLDEPTAALGVQQRATVGELIARLRSKGFGILLISHDVPEVLKIADRVTVLRLGRRVATRRIRDVDMEWIVRAMVGGLEA